MIAPNELAAQIQLLQKSWQQATAPFGDLQRLQQISAPLAEFQKRASLFEGMGRPAWQSLLADFTIRQQAISRAIAALGSGYPAILERIARAEKTSSALDRAGWLPHYTTPIRELEAAGDDPGVIRELLAEHYRAHWKDVRVSIEGKLVNYLIDEEARETFIEALNAHENGLYRSACRVLLPEIERVTSVELQGGGTDHHAARRRLHEIAGELSPADIEPGGLYALNLYRRLTGHLYDQVRTVEDHTGFAKDPIPNRHAALHGLIAYSSPQNSLNTIFMADYIFQVITALKAGAEFPPEVQSVVAGDANPEGT